MTYNHQTTFNQTPNPLFIVLSGPSGVGKDAVLHRMKEKSLPLQYITTVTTRQRRPQEIDGLDYHFISQEQFQGMVARNELLEWAQVYRNWYGVPRQPIKEALGRGEDIIVKIDVQGAATIKRILPQAVFIFLVPFLREELGTRLSERRTETPFDLALRLEKAKEEIKQISRFDYVVFNKWGEIDQAVADIEHIIRAEKCRVHPRRIVI